MLYDLFICHAAEDKDTLVRPLAALLREHHIAVWYDEFELKLGDSIRQAIDRGLSQSRFGLVVLSPSFFAKSWPQYELDGLAERDMAGPEKVILPLWHEIEKAEVMAVSPSLANRRAARSVEGLEHVVAQVVDVVRPTGSPLVEAWTLVSNWGLDPPTISDPYWLQVVQASNRVPGFGAAIPAESSWEVWSFPLPSSSREPKAWGTRLAWTALQLNWVETAERTSISVITPPDEVWSFIEAHPGLLEMCMDFPDLAAEYAPQLTIPQFSHDLSDTFDEALRASMEEAQRRANTSPEYGTALTVDGTSPLCDQEWVLRHPTFGAYESGSVANSYFAGSMFGPTVSPWEHADHLFWLLSAQSDWIPRHVHQVLLDGMAAWGVWLWTESRRDKGRSSPCEGALWKALHDSLYEGPFRWTEECRRDLQGRLNESINSLSLPESVEEIETRFMDGKILDAWVEEAIKRQANRDAPRGGE